LGGDRVGGRRGSTEMNGGMEDETREGKGEGEEWGCELKGAEAG